jgi:geranylgeranyl diphosphate synthase, type II
MTVHVRGSTEPEALLASYRDRVWPEIERHLPTGEPARWLYEPLADYPRRPGKGLRGALCVATCSAHGGLEEDALPSAAAIELVHNAFLIHDDIEDGSRWRRGRPTLHEREGLPLALNAGDALAVLGFEALRANAERLGRRMSAFVLDEFTAAIWRTLEGQALELGWRRDGVTDLTPRDYLELVLYKSCWYTTIAPLRIGALIGSRGTADLRPVTRFGFLLGAAFQITDDVLNLTGSQSVYGKEICGDLREGKRSLMLIHALAAAEPADKAAAVAMLRRADGERTDEELALLATMFERYGSIVFAREFARGVSEAAAAAFPAAFAQTPRPDEAEVVAQLVEYVVDRTR